VTLTFFVRQNDASKEAEILSERGNCYVDWYMAKNNISIEMEPNEKEEETVEEETMDERLAELKQKARKFQQSKQTDELLRHALNDYLQALQVHEQSTLQIIEQTFQLCVYLCEKSQSK
jgi:precorrin isomerase